MRGRILAISFATLVAASTVTLVAGAAGEAAAPDKPQPAAEKKDEHKSLAFEVNPIGIGIGRYSISVEYLPAVHHALILTPHFDYVSADVELPRLKYTEKFVGGGAELGYRF